MTDEVIRLTSHYLRCTVEDSFESVSKALEDSFGNVYSRKLSGDLGQRKELILGEEYFFRVNSDVAVLIVLEERSSHETEIEIISCAGGAGMLEISYSAHSAYAHKVKEVLQTSGFKVELREEISNFSRNSS